MLIDGLNLVSGSQALNFKVESGENFPDQPTTSRLFYKLGLNAGLYTFTDQWVLLTDAVHLPTVGQPGGVAALDETGAVPTNQLPPLNYVPLATKASPNGVATLGADGKIPTDQLPALSITDTHVATSEEQMLALTAQRGDVCIRQDVGRSYILAAEDASVLSNWLEIVADTYTKAQIDSKISTASTFNYHATPYDIATAVVNKPSGSAKVLRFVAPRLFTIPANAVGSLFRAGTVSLASATFQVFKNSTQIGTITFAAGVANATCVITETIFDIGDTLSIVAPPVQDSKLADIMITIAARL